VAVIAVVKLLEARAASERGVTRSARYESANSSAMEPRVPLYMILLGRPEEMGLRLWEQSFLQAAGW
jgi:hypothetical protein